MSATTLSITKATDSLYLDARTVDVTSGQTTQIGPMVLQPGNELVFVSQNGVLTTYLRPLTDGCPTCGPVRDLMRKIDSDDENVKALQAYVELTS